MRPRRLWITVGVAAALLPGGLALSSCGGGDGTEATPTVAPPATTGETEMTNTGTEPTGTETTTGEEKPAPVVVRISVVGGVPKGGIVRQTVGKGDRVVLVVSSDVADEIHLHGYDIARRLAAGGTARIGFVANIPGRFEIELEDRGVQIGDLTVEP